MRRRRRRVDPVVARQRMLALQTVAVALLLLVMAYLVYRALHVV